MFFKEYAFLLLIKPEAVHRCLVGEIISFLEHNGLKIMGIKMLVLPRETAAALYRNVEAAPFYEELMSYLTTWPCVAVAIDGRFTHIEHVSELCGRIGQWGTVRGCFANKQVHNIMHCSEIAEQAAYEAHLLFTHAELIEYRHALEDYL